jgi:hypothetical protein
MQVAEGKTALKVIQSSSQNDLCMTPSNQSPSGAVTHKTLPAPIRERRAFILINLLGFRIIDLSKTRRLSLHSSILGSKRYIGADFFHLGNDPIPLPY